jgi:hypothetical protein
MSPAAPVIVVLPDSTEIKSALTNPGLLGYLIEKSANKRTGAQVADLRKLFEGGAVAEQAQQIFSCLNVVPGNSKCRDVQVVGVRDDIEALIKEKHYPGAIEVRLVSLMSDQRYWVRATVAEYSNDAGRVNVKRRYSASYETRAPAELIASSKKDPTPLQEYWLADDPARLKTEVFASFPELRDLLTWMRENSSGSSGNKALKNLPNLKTLREAGRLPCRGVSCTQLHFVKEEASRWWIVNTASYGTDLGPVVTSVDNNAAQNGIYPFNMAMAGH